MQIYYYLNNKKKRFFKQGLKKKVSLSFLDTSRKMIIYFYLDKNELSSYNTEQMFRVKVVPIVVLYMGVASLKLKGGQLFKIDIHLFLIMVKN